jgi:hypothetical protein
MGMGIVLSGKGIKKYSIGGGVSKCVREKDRGGFEEDLTPVSPLLSERGF